MKDNISLLNNMIQDMQQQKGIYRISGYWTRHTLKIKKAILRHGLQDFRSRENISKSYGDPPYCDDPINLLPPFSLQALALNALRRIPPTKYLYKKFHKINKRLLSDLTHYKNLFANSQIDHIGKELLPNGKWPDTLAGKPNNKFTIEGIEVGQANLRSLIEIRDCNQIVDFSSFKVGMEIGGGIGAYTHMLIHCFPNIKKMIYLDIPPVLYVSTQYLRHYFGDAVIDYNQTRELKKISFQDNDKLEIYCIAPWQLPSVEASVDYFWNSASFQEMPKESVNNYALEISRLQNPLSSKVALYIYERHDGNTLSYETITNLFKSNGINLTYFPNDNSCNMVQPGRRYISDIPTQ